MNTDLLTIYSIPDLGAILNHAIKKNSVINCCFTPLYVIHVSRVQGI